MTAVVEGPYLAVCCLLAAAGADKAIRPGNTAKAMNAAGFRVRRREVRAAALVEAAVGAGAALTGSALLATAVAVSYSAFAVFVAAAIVRRWPLSTCGCFSTVDTPPTYGHVAVDLAAAGVAAVVAVTGAPTILGAVRGSPGHGIALLVSSAAVTGLLFLLLADAARLGSIRSSLRHRAP